MNIEPQELLAVLKLVLPYVEREAARSGDGAADLSRLNSTIQNLEFALTVPDFISSDDRQYEPYLTKVSYLEAERLLAAGELIYGMMMDGEEAKLVKDVRGFESVDSDDLYVLRLPNTESLEAQLERERAMKCAAVNYIQTLYEGGKLPLPAPESFRSALQECDPFSEHGFFGRACARQQKELDQLRKANQQLTAKLNGMAPVSGHVAATVPQINGELLEACRAYKRAQKDGGISHADFSSIAHYKILLAVDNAEKAMKAGAAATVTKPEYDVSELAHEAERRGLSV